MKKTVTTRYEEEDLSVSILVEVDHDGHVDTVTLEDDSEEPGTKIRLTFDDARELWAFLGRALDAVDGTKGKVEGPG